MTHAVMVEIFYITFLMRWVVNRAIQPDSTNYQLQRRDVCILEEPEHLHWYHDGARWPDYFRFYNPIYSLM